MAVTLAKALKYISRMCFRKGDICSYQFSYMRILLTKKWHLAQLIDRQTERNYLVYRILCLFFFLTVHKEWYLFIIAVFHLLISIVERDMSSHFGCHLITLKHTCRETNEAKHLRMPPSSCYKYECNRDVDCLWLFLMKDIVIIQAL